MLPKIKKTVKMFLFGEEGGITKHDALRLGMLLGSLSIAGAAFSRSVHACDAYPPNCADNDHDDSPPPEHPLAELKCVGKDITDVTDPNIKKLVDGGFTPIHGNWYDQADPSKKHPLEQAYQGATAHHCPVWSESKVTCTAIGHTNSLAIKKESSADEEKIIASHAHEIKEESWVQTRTKDGWNGTSSTCFGSSSI